MPLKYEKYTWKNFTRYEMVDFKPQAEFEGVTL